MANAGSKEVLAKLHMKHFAKVTWNTCLEVHCRREGLCASLQIQISKSQNRGPCFRGSDPHDCVPVPVFSPLCLLFPFHFPSLNLGPLCRGQSVGSHRTHGLFQQCRARPLMCPRVATLHPPAFQRPVLGYCVHILSLFVHLLEGPSPADPLPQLQPP